MTNDEYDRWVEFAGLNQRFVPFRFASMFTRGEQWGVLDNSLLRPEPIKDWHRGRTKRPWRGTKDAAVHLAHIMSKKRDGIEMINGPGDMDKSQIIHYANLARNKGRSVPRETKKRVFVKSTFSKCDTCGAMYKGDRHCG